MRIELEDYLLSFESVDFVSIGFNTQNSAMLISVGTARTSLAVAETGVWGAQLSKRGFEFEVQVLKGRTKG